MRSADDVRLAKALAEEGLRPNEIARRTGIPPSTIRYWLKSGYGRQPMRRERPIEALPRADYAYVLGLYLGDGHIARVGRSYALRIFMDSRYTGIIREARRALANLVAPNKAVIQPCRGVNMVIVRAYCISLPELFPQHGPGRKHERPIVLEPWQQDIVDEHPDLLVRGLIQSDGCRVMNKVWGGRYAYPRYFFTQVSTDIMRLFCQACDQLGVAYARTNYKTVSIARRESVAVLDEIAGPKA